MILYIWTIHQVSLVIITWRVESDATTPCLKCIEKRCDFILSRGRMGVGYLWNVLDQCNQKENKKFVSFVINRFLKVINFKEIFNYIANFLILCLLLVLKFIFQIFCHVRNEFWETKQIKNNSSSSVVYSQDLAAHPLRMELHKNSAHFLSN